MRRAVVECVLLVGLVGLSLPAWGPVTAGFVAAAFDPAAWTDLPSGTGRAGVLARSGGLALFVAVLATLIGSPMAQVLRSSGVRTAALLMAPVWIPSWLIYAGLNLARAPDTVVGAAFLEWALDPARAWFGESNRWAIRALAQGVAIGSLALWSAPVAALVMAGVEDPERDAARELARTEAMGWGRRIVMALRLRARSLGFAVVVVGLLTLGSAVPLHLAQVETDAIGLWRALAERPRDRWNGVWLAVGPQMALALAGAWWIASRLGTEARAGQGVAGGAVATPRSGPGTRTAAWGLWSLAVIAPVALMVWSLDSVASLWRWPRMESDALWTSGWIAAAGGAIAACVGLGVAAAAGSEHAASRWIGRAVAVGTVFGALVPGVFVGAAIARMGLDEAVGSVMASAGRTAFVGALAGLIVARSESADERAGRALDGAGDAWGWLRANTRRAGRSLRLAAGVWLGAFVLGLHEIEASVMVRPPGRGNLPQQMLSDLHYARLESLSAGGAVMGMVGIAVGVLAGLALGLGTLGRRKTRIGNPGGTGQ